MNPSATDLDADVATRNWLRGLAWPAFALIAWIVFKLTAEAALGVIVFCLKFGWNDLLTAIWLRCVDPCRHRAQACGWFYVAAAILRVSLVAVMLMFAIALGTPAQIVAPIEFVTAAIEACVGFGLLVVTTCVAFVVAWRHGVKVWVDSAIHQARRDRAWPLQDYCRANSAGYLLIVALAVAASLLIVAVMFGVFTLAEAFGGQNDLTAIACTAVLLAPLAFAVWSIGWLKDRASRTVVAAVPDECWGATNDQ
ncbi:MAG TPA: hypothetical protein VGX78_08040 [Pirellulales bacterium]|jgi:hypothetical protein|nr:hypothetical protein [Pirellulales bacterium]